MNAEPWSRRAATMMIAFLGACTSTVQAAPYVMFKDPNCGCCTDWAEHARSSLHHAVEVREDESMDSVKARLGVPADLASCHTTVVDGYIIEGHVPAKEVERLLAERPEGVKGLAVAGMPMGSPGMEAQGHYTEYEVIAFGDAGRTVYARYP